MKIAFLGLRKSFDYSQIGGTDSFMRRLINGLLSRDKDLEISCVFYNSEEQVEIKHVPRFVSRYFPTFEEALQNLIDSPCTHVISTYLLPKDRLSFAKFRKENRAKLFHNILFFYPDSKIKQFIKFSELFLFPYNGRIFCVSKRQCDYVRRLANNVVYLPPPVPEEYFLLPGEKAKNEKINVTFIGRIDPRKGIKEVIDLFRALRNNSIFKYTIYGIHIPWDKKALENRNWLKNQDEIEYMEQDRQSYSPQVEEMVQNVLKNTDILIQPYQTLDSTLDTPLLLLEAMASLCAVITTNVGSISAIYGKSKFIIAKQNFVSNALNLLKSLSFDHINKERERIYIRNQKLNFDTNKVVTKFLNAFQE